MNHRLDDLHGRLQSVAGTPAERSLADVISRGPGAGVELWQARKVLDDSETALFGAVARDATENRPVLFVTDRRAVTAKEGLFRWKVTREIARADVARVRLTDLKLFTPVQVHIEPVRGRPAVVDLDLNQDDVPKVREQLRSVFRERFET